MHSEAKISALETLSVGSELVTFQATDADLGINSEIAFSIGAGNMHDTFRIDPQMGTLFLEKPLDFEMQRSYHLNITASDQGNPSLVSSISFVITVEDANDNAPVFPRYELYPTYSTTFIFIHYYYYSFQHGNCQANPGRNSIEHANRYRYSRRSGFRA
jgi:hypothetical protein